MSSIITAAHSAILARIAAILPDHQRLINPYRIESNPDPLLSLGYGILLADGRNTKRQVSHRVSIERIFKIVISRHFYGTDLDASARSTAALAIMEDQLLLIKDFESDTTLNRTVIGTEFQSDSGIQFVKTTADNFLYLESLFAVQYWESL